MVISLKNYETRAGISPATDELIFNISTQKAEDFLQKKFNKLTEVLRKQGNDAEDVHIDLMSKKYGTNFCPFLILMDTSVLASNVGRKDNQKNDRELAIFNPDQDERSVRLEGLYAKLLTGYWFNQDDIDCFRSNQWRNKQKMSIKAAEQIRECKRPRMKSFANGQTKKVIVFLDPIKVFHDMLENPDQNAKEKFVVDIKETQKGATKMNHNFKVTKVLKRGKKGFSGDDHFLDDIEKYLNRK